MHRAILIVALTLLSFVAPAWANDPSAEEAERARRIEYIQKAVKGDVSPVPGRKMVSAATGFYIAPRTILTNRHVVAGCAAVTIRGIEGKTLVGTVQAMDKKEDLALISSETTPERTATFRAATSYTTGAAVATIGFPDQGLPRIEPFLTKGTVLGPDRDDGRASRFVIKADIRQGNSGGPVFDTQGTVIGILNAKIDSVRTYRATGRSVDNVGFAIANGPVFNFLAKQKVVLTLNESRVIVPESDLLAAVKSYTVRVGCWR